jgi:hypothetical protein
MSRNCIFTVNAGEFLTNYARKRMLRACDRWDCDYVEIHDCVAPGYPACSKHVGPERLAGYNKILFLDADIVISDHAPNPFELCVEWNVFYAVGDYVQPVNHCQAWIDGPYRLGIQRVLADNRLLIAPPMDTFFNTGFWMFYNNPAMQAMFKRALDLTVPIVRDEKMTFFIEQGVLNTVAHNDPTVKVSLLPETWNHIIPKDCGPIPDFYCNHFGGWAHEVLKALDNHA